MCSNQAKWEDWNNARMEPKSKGLYGQTEEGGERRMGSNAEEGAALRGIAAHTPLPDFRGFGRITPSFEAPFAALSLLYPRQISPLNAR